MSAVPVPFRDRSPLLIDAAFRADHAYQPIVNTSTLRVHGFEALARLAPDGEHADVCSLLDGAAIDGSLRAVERTLLRNAIGKFARFPDAAATRLFCNVDNRSYDGDMPSRQSIGDIISGSGLPPASLCLEISERAPVRSIETMKAVLAHVAGQGVQIAIDDFGVGMSGLHMLLQFEPHYVKIDRSFIDGLAANARKQAIVTKLCGLAHALGFMTVAEGVESEADFRTARDLGCDLAQGYHIARPTTSLSELRMAYGDRVMLLASPIVSPRVAELLSPLKPLQVDQPLSAAVDMFKADPQLRIAPLVDSEMQLMGAIYEEDIRSYLLSDFGRALLVNRGVDQRLRKLVRRCPIGDAHATVDAIVNSYVLSEGANGMVLVADGRFVGHLSNHAVLRLAAERELSAAREQNPLTLLPGNESVGRHIGQTLAGGADATLALFDFDHFKAFNDGYGFAAGDRALGLFANLLRRLQHDCGAFIGHLGGDDFFAAISDGASSSEAALRDVANRFAIDVASLYSDADRAAGGIRGIDRYGGERFFPLLRASIGIVHLPASRSHLSSDRIERALAEAKRAAKASACGIAIGELPPTATMDLVAHARGRLGLD